MRVRNAPLITTIAILCVTLTFGVHCTGEGLAESQFDCETAAVELADCCTGFKPGFLTCDRETFQTQAGGCGGEVTTTYPTLTESDSMCILSEDCATLRSTGVCDRAMQAAAHGPFQTSPPPTDNGGCGGPYVAPVPAYDAALFEDVAQHSRDAGRDTGRDVVTEADSDAADVVTYEDGQILDEGGFDGEVPSDGGPTIPTYMGPICP